MRVATAVRGVLAELGFPVELAMTPAGGGGAMVALVPSPADAARLAVDSGELADELHLTLFFLGKAEMFPPDVRAAVVGAVRGMVQRREQGPVMGNAFAASMFNPTGDEPCWVLGVGDLADAPGDRLGVVREMVSEAWADGMVPMPMPEQRTPWAPHITLAYTGDVGLAGAVAERTGPVAFDRLRVAFGGEVTDIPLDGSRGDLAAIVRDELRRTLHLPGRHDQDSHGDGTGALKKLLKRVRIPTTDGGSLHLSKHDDGTLSIRIPFDVDPDDEDEDFGKVDTLTFSEETAREFAEELQTIREVVDDYDRRAKKLLKAAEAINPGGGGDDDPDPESKAAWDAVGEMLGDGQRITGGQLDGDDGMELHYEARAGDDPGDTSLLIGIKRPGDGDDWDLHEATGAALPGAWLSWKQFLRLRKETGALVADGGEP